VKLLVDVRAVAASRRPGFSKTSSPPGSTSAVFPICTMRGLWHAEDGRDAARSGKFDTLHKIYAAHLRRAGQRRLDELSSLVSKNPGRSAFSYDAIMSMPSEWIAEIIRDRDDVKSRIWSAPQV